MLTTWLYVPFGVMLILLACFGVNSLIELSSVSFPASVACMIALFFALIASEALLGDKRTKKAVNLLDIPVTHQLNLLNGTPLILSVWFCFAVHQYLLLPFFRTSAAQSSHQWH